MNSQRTDNKKFNDVFNYTNLYNAYLDCRKGVNWKTSVKNYSLQAISNIARTYNELMNGTYKGKPFSKFYIKERGKTRLIQALHIKDRVVQKCFCDNFLVPLLSKRLIYDNGACMKGKGLSFATRRLKTHLHRYYRQNKTNEGYVLTFDFSKFFETIDHKLLLDMVLKLIEDDKLKEIFSLFVNQFDGDTGLGLGSQISQICALFYANRLDHYIKERLHMKYYGRYMDDGYIISNSKEELILCKEAILKIANQLKLKVNVKKTRIWQLHKGFMYLNKHWRLTGKGYIALKPSHSTLLRMRKRYQKLVAMKKSDDVLQRYKSSTSGFLRFFNNRRLEDYVYN